MILDYDKPFLSYTLIDAKTGIEYLKTPEGFLTPRLGVGK